VLSPDIESHDASQAGFVDAEFHAAALATKMDTTAARKAYESIVMGIDAALLSGQKLQLVKPGEIIHDTLPLKMVHHFKVSLPARPTQVYINVQTVTGMMPDVLASREVEKPHIKNHEFKAKDGRLLYEHVLRTDGDDLEDESNMVPSFQTLYFSLHAEAAECSCKIFVAMRPIKIVISRGHTPARLGRSRLEAKIKDLQREPNELSKFEEHCRDLKDKYAERQFHLHRGRNFREENVLAVPFTDVPSKLTKLRGRALAACARQDEASKRRAERDHEAEQRKLTKLKRRRQREMEEEAQRLAELAEEMQRAWLQDLAMTIFIRRLEVQVSGGRHMRTFFSNQISSAGVMHHFIIRWFCYHRRRRLYAEIVRFRVALMAYARHARMMTFHMAHTKVSGFLKQYAFHREAPSVIGSLRRMRMRVVQVQRLWLQKRMRREAYIELFLPIWVELQETLVKEKPSIMDDDGDDPPSRHMSPEPTKKSMTQAKTMNSTAGSPDSRSRSRGRASRKNTVTTNFGDLSSDYVAPDGQDVVPPSYIRVLLNDYLISMERSRESRIKAWEEEKAKLALQKDLQDVLGTTGQASSVMPTLRPRPPLVYRDMDELKALVEEKLHMWRTGHFREVRHNYLRLLRDYWRQWERYVRSPWLRDVVVAEPSRARATAEMNEGRAGSKRRPHLVRGSTLAPPALDATELMMHKLSGNFKNTMKERLAIEGNLSAFEDLHEHRGHRK